LAVTGLSASTVAFSTRNTTVSMTQVLPPTIRNLISSRCLIALSRYGWGILASVASTTVTGSIVPD
jgi:hypothetical protein